MFFNGLVTYLLTLYLTNYFNYSGGPTYGALHGQRFLKKSWFPISWPPTVIRNRDLQQLIDLTLEQTHAKC